MWVFDLLILLSLWKTRNSGFNTNLRVWGHFYPPPPSPPYPPQPFGFSLINQKDKKSCKCGKIQRGYSRFWISGQFFINKIVITPKQVIILTWNTNQYLTRQKKQDNIKKLMMTSCQQILKQSFWFMADFE